MNSIVLNKIKAKANELIKTLSEEIPKLEEGAKPVEPDVSLGRLTRMEAIQSMQMNKAQIERNNRRIFSLKESLKLIDSDSFGLCVDCEEYIPPKRLMLIPDAKKCIECSN